MKEDEDEKAIQGENNYDEDNNNDKTEFISIRNFLISFLVLVALRNEYFIFARPVRVFFEP